MPPKTPTVTLADGTVMELTPNNMLALAAKMAKAEEEAKAQKAKAEAAEKRAQNTGFGTIRLGVSANPDSKGAVGIYGLGMKPVSAHFLSWKKVVAHFHLEGSDFDKALESFRTHPKVVEAGQRYEALKASKVNGGSAI